MNVSRLMTKNPEFAAPDTSLHQAAAKMRDLDIGALPVYEGGKAIGFITDRDIAIRAIAEGMDPNTTRVSEVMTGEVIVCHQDDSLDDAARIMEDNQVRRLLVLDNNEKVVGILSLGDIAVESHDEHICAEVLERVSEPCEVHR